MKIIVEIIIQKLFKICPTNDKDTSLYSKDPYTLLMHSNTVIKNRNRKDDMVKHHKISEH